jgi:hypothetical protein
MDSSNDACSRRVPERARLGRRQSNGVWVRSRTVDSAAFGDFECALLDIQKQLSPDMFMLACINCAFSDYSPLRSPGRSETYVRTPPLRPQARETRA